jgi:GNAT superfamily N-acetyltransferase
VEELEGKMPGKFIIKQVENPDRSVWGVITQGLREYNTKQAGEDNAAELCLVLYSPDQQIVGGVIAETYWNWLFINVMWVKEDMRGSGFGAKLLKRTEEEAVKRGVKHAFLDTFTFQAPGFYEKNGYTTFGKLDGFPPGYQRIFYKKDLG